jgi:hypothetical protein
MITNIYRIKSILRYFAAFCMAILSFNPLYSQITITAADFPTAGMLVVKDVDTSTTISPGNPGTGQVWDFSNLVISYTDSTLYMNPGGQPGVQNFPDANLVEKNARASANADGSYNYTFYEAGSEGWKLDGADLAAGFWGIVFHWHILVSPPPFTLQLPAVYNGSWNQVFDYDSYTSTWANGSQSDTGLVASSWTMNQLVDGSGTIITPVGSYEALRVSEHVVMIDTVYSYVAGTGWVFDQTNTSEWTTYRWFANGIGEVGSIRVGDKKGSSGFSYFKSSTIVGEQELSKNNDLNIFPVPATDRLNISTSEQIQKTEIIDLAGNLLCVNTGSPSINISSLNPGVYFVKVYLENSTITRKFIKK